jgi:hypothetical protein
MKTYTSVGERIGSPNDDVSYTNSEAHLLLSLKPHILLISGACDDNCTKVPETKSPYGCNQIFSEASAATLIWNQTA